MCLFAAAYKSEAEAGEALAEAIKTGLVKREDLFFVTTKLWNSDHGHAVEACRDSSKKLQLDYIDLYLIHFPVATKHIGAYNTLFYCYYFIYLYKSVYISLRQ
ncbi:hypothetical protein Peur_052308 [Populus x canadensis]